MISYILVVEQHCTYFFFFQAEDGIRDDLVTGVQTCALPISRTRPPRTHVPSLPKPCRRRPLPCAPGPAPEFAAQIPGKVRPRQVRRRTMPATFHPPPFVRTFSHVRSEERRVGKECISRWSPQ